jgi:hypothetical protein
VRVWHETATSERNPLSTSGVCIQKHQQNTAFLNPKKVFQQNPMITLQGAFMSGFKVVNQVVKFDTYREIEFVDLTDQVQGAASASGLKNGIVHVFAPHATGILIVEEKDDALLEDIKTFLEALVPRLVTISIQEMLMRIYGLCFCRRIRRYP